MRWNLRNLAALASILLGSMIVTGVVYSLLRENPDSTLYRGDGQDDATVGRIDPLPAGGGKLGKGRGANVADARDHFNSKYGDRGEHEVTVRLSGRGRFQLEWRDNRDSEAGVIRGATTTRTVKGGFPLALVVIQGAPSATCTISVDGIEKTSENATNYEVKVCYG
jgi:hypothetical protein